MELWPTSGAQQAAWPSGQRVPGPHDWAQQSWYTRSQHVWAPDIESQNPFRHWIIHVIIWYMSAHWIEAHWGP